MIDQIPVGRLAVFSYLITDPVTKEAALIDPGANPSTILENIRKRGADLRWILCTHTHPDHIGATSFLKKATGAPLAVHDMEVDLMSKWTRRLLVRLMGGRTEKIVDVRLKEGDRLALGKHALRVLHTPGHSPGSICLHMEGHLFTGDTLFVGGVGRTDLPGSSASEMEHSIRVKVLSLPGTTRVWPGHDYGMAPSSLLCDEMRGNPFLQGFPG